jgi:glucosamine-6-phosphate deaminase
MEQIMPDINKTDLYQWCKIPYTELASHPQRKTPFRLCHDSQEMGSIMARELVDEIQGHNRRGEETRAIIPCGPNCWYEPFTRLVNLERVSLKNLVVFHMDDCLDWQGKPLPPNHPFSFRTIMERVFYDPIHSDLSVPEENRYFLEVGNINQIQAAIAAAPVDITYGGWGQDGHLAYNQARRHPFSQISLEDLRNSTVRIQENNLDTIMAISQRVFGAAYQFVPPMSVTLGLREILPSKKIRVFSDTGAWKQTALRVALFGSLTPEYPITLLQEHPNALITATIDTARHPISEHPEWDLGIR